MAFMISINRASIIRRLLNRLNLRFPTLFVVLGILTLLDLLIPDIVPFIDEIGLALMTMLLGMWKNRKTANFDGRTGRG